MPVRKLPPEIFLKIAAGEVVQRPASVVKELIDNSIDAGAGQISISVKKGGIDEIIVVDDGCGMNRDDAVLAFERHATSKISSIEDLDAIKTMGFRGEALAAIVAVSKLELITRENVSDIGIKIQRDGEHEAKILETGAPVGTSIRVRNIFYNLPARRKFLKTVPTEFSHIAECVNRFSLIWHNIGFSLKHNERNVLEYPSVEDPVDRVMSVFSSDWVSQIIPVELETDGIIVNGYVSQPDLAFNGSNRIYFFVNKRYVSNRLMMRALGDAYQNRIAPRRYPLAVLHMEIDPERIDINVHPTKEEIRFDNEQKIYKAVFASVSKALDIRHIKGSKAVNENIEIGDDTEQASSLKLDVFLDEAIDKFHSESDVPVELVGRDEKVQSPLETYKESMDKEVVFPQKPVQLPFDEIIDGPPERERGIKPVAQVWNSYIVGEWGKEMVVIDQHAAHERILFQRYVEENPGGFLASQGLMFPFNMEIPVDQVDLVNDNVEEWKRLGFEISYLGGRTFSVSGIPITIKESDAESLFMDIINQWAMTGSTLALEERRRKILIKASCRGAIMFGDPLSMEEMESLVRQLESTKNPFTCPHGRPIIAKFPESEVRKWFQR